MTFPKKDQTMSILMDETQLRKEKNIKAYGYMESIKYIMAPCNYKYILLLRQMREKNL